MIRACRGLGIRSVAIFSDADRDSLHVRLADEAVCCGPARASESYLDVNAIVEIAERVGADAVHPGYGFLSENADFAAAVGAAGLTFIGPTPEVIRSMGRKVAARERMVAAGVPVVPGSEAIRDPEVARRTAAEIGYPVLVKASAGGGGRGMRRVEDEAGLGDALERAASEAEAAFGDGAIYLEKCLIGPRHIELQVMADSTRHTIHLGERECSIQRRHQKLVEEAPAYGMTPALRNEMGLAAVRAAQAVDYVGAGTVEFLVDASGAFYFLEMNTRIQVEHPVTEAVTGLDLVDLQIRMAAGERLVIAQEDVALEGHAIEVRVYAEDPDKGFIPSPGPIVAWSTPNGPGIRLDAGFEGGQTVTPHYDPMIAKLIATGRNREEALVRLSGALEEFTIAGIRTGLPFLRRVCENAVFRKGAYDTGFIEAHMTAPDALPALTPETRAIVAGVVARRFALASDPRASRSDEVDSSDATTPLEIEIAKSTPIEVDVTRSAEGVSQVRVDGREVDWSVSDDRSPAPVVLDGDRVVRMTVVSRKPGTFDVGLRDRVLRVKCGSREP